MKYISTRGSAPSLGFDDVLLTGLARDGGLYVPVELPTFDQTKLWSFIDRPYAEVAIEVMWPFIEGSIDRDVFSAMVSDTYSSSVFRHPDVCPLVDIGDQTWLLELFHGPTLAFKDVALQLVGRLFDHVLSARNQRLTIVGATSGDTGSAAIEACRDRETLDVFILHPAGRVSEVQRRQMTTVDSPNVHNIAIEGSFDDCQDLVKGLFGDLAFRDEMRLSAVNSINWARILPQVVYYFTAAISLETSGRPVSFAVPTGNFGNVLAGDFARRMGLAVDQLVVGSNRNDILTRFIKTGRMEMTEVHPTTSPSMDIQVSSNIERLLFELHGRDGELTSKLMEQFRATGSIEVSDEHMAELRRVFDGARLDDVEVAEVISSTYERTGILIDPHTAVGLGASIECRRDPSVAMVALATAHPAKFPDAVEAATGIRPSLPQHLADLFSRPEHVVELPNDLATVASYVKDTATRA